jgi:putative ABC transport system permease protein
MRIPLLRGRTIEDSDTEISQRVAVINEAMARLFWPNQEVLDRQFTLKSHPKEKIRVVGVVKDIHFEDFDGPIGAFFYTAMAQEYSPLQTLHVRTLASPESMIPVVQQEIDKFAPGLPMFDVETMAQALNTLNGLLLFQLGAGIAAALGILGLVLAIVGVYGIVSYVTSQRTHEIGIRLALGAEPRQILTMVLRQGLLIIVVGMAIGLISAAAAGRLAADFLVGVSPTDPLIFSGVSVFLVCIALLACYIPARRATKVDPMVALRYE